MIDASIASTWCFKAESTAYTDAILDAVSGLLIAAAPRLLLYEVYNTTLIGLRRQRIVQADADAFSKLFSGLSIQITDPPSYGAVFDLAQRHSLTVYDVPISISPYARAYRLPALTMTWSKRPGMSA